ncbi:hypothetical protein K9B35_16500 [Sphingomonas sp. R647]|uniref:HPr kinase/phosphorylase n=1 Tax=Sphingomonas sp. R647 TaxID=2875233 RepID=UPI001CD239F5|nr:hypothetical protein [Sphingomonas sp. R647]MCA1199570.1 hypothetical protein [Sphingomonas sp. R647]
MKAYRVSGLTVDSDIALPSFAGIERGDSADIVVRAGDVPDSVADARLIGPNWVLAGDAIILGIPGVVRMLMHGGDTLTYAVEPGAASEEVAIFLTGTGIGILLHQRRAIVLHASAVRVGDHAVLFCGPSGEGKSTLAAALGEAGHDLVADDFCRIELREGAAPLVHPDGRQMRLWEDATEGLGIAGRRGAQVRAAIRKFYVAPRAVSDRPLAIGAIYALREARAPFAPGLHVPNLVDAALIVRRNAYRPLLVREMDQKQLYFDAAARLVRDVEIRILARPLDFGAMPDAVATLQAHWRALGLSVERAA